MKLLFDQNLSFKLCQNRPSLILIPKSNHVRLLGLLEDGDLSRHVITSQRVARMRAAR